MSMRAKTKPEIDQKIFHNTAGKTKKVNIAPKIMRGGIRF